MHLIRLRPVLRIRITLIQIRITLMRIRLRILPFTMIRIRILSFPDLDPDPLRLPPIHFDVDPDPAFHFDADQDPAFHIDADPDPASKMMRIRIRNTGYGHNKTVRQQPKLLILFVNRGALSRGSEKKSLYSPVFRRTFTI
jgi:hypothetical protein